MRRVHFHPSALLMGASFLVLASVGCEARDCENVKEVEYEGDGAAERQNEEGACVELVQTKRWWGETEDFTGAYESGKNVVVANGNGEINVTVSSRTDIMARFEPFVARAFDTCNDQPDTGNERCLEIDEDLSKQELVFQETDGNYVIQAVRTDGRATLGANITVELPSSFNGRLSVDQNNGPTVVGPMGDAAAVAVESGNGSCDINTGNAPEIDIRCENGSTDVVIGGITAGSDLKQIFKESGDLGDLTVQFPSTDVPFSVSAQSAGPDVALDPADVTSVGCTKAGTDPRSVTVSCNAATSEDPVYTITSYESLVDVTLIF